MIDKGFIATGHFRDINSQDKHWRERRSTADMDSPGSSHTSSTIPVQRHSGQEHPHSYHALDPRKDDAVFLPSRCLFCRFDAGDITFNIEHMRKLHGLFIPNMESLIVGVEDLLGYLHVIVFDLKECIFCHTARRTAYAAQQHMMGKGHCRIDLESDRAEMLDFYQEREDPRSGQWEERTFAKV